MMAVFLRRRISLIPNRESTLRWLFCLDEVPRGLIVLAGMFQQANRRRLDIRSDEGLRKSRSAGVD